MASITIQLSAPNLELASVLADVTGGVLHQNGPWLTIEGKRLEITRSQVEQAWGRPMAEDKWRSLTRTRRGHVVEVHRSGDRNSGRTGSPTGRCHVRAIPRSNSGRCLANAAFGARSKAEGSYHESACCPGNRTLSPQCRQ